MQTPIKHTPFRILIADDDVEDIQFVREAFTNNQLPVDIHEVEDGQYLIDLLKEKAVLPQLILLDLNMPRKTGHESLAEIRKDPRLCKIPVVILTTSKNREDIDIAYKLGANC